MFYIVDDNEDTYLGDAFSSFLVNIGNKLRRTPNAIWARLAHKIYHIKNW